jgi:replicative DNA helicase
LYRPEYYKIDFWPEGEHGGEPEPSANQAEIIIAKHRNGSTGEVRLSFIKEMGKFTDLDKFGHGNYFMPPEQTPDHFSQLKTAINPGDAFGIPEPPKVSGSAMNDSNLDDDDDFPY